MTSFSSRLVLNLLAFTFAAITGVLAVTDAAAAKPIHLWSQRFGGVSVDEGFSVAVDASGNVFVTGYFNGTVNFGGGNLTSAGAQDIFLAKYNAAGVHQWSKSFGSPTGDFGRSVAVDVPSGSVFVAGHFTGTVDFNFPNPPGGLTSAGGSDIFVAKFNSAGAHQWSQRFGGTGSDAASSIEVDPSTGGVVVTGVFSNVVNFGGGNLTSAGGADTFLAKYNAAGVHQWSQRFGSTGADGGIDVAVHSSGNVAVTGNFQGTVNFGGGNVAGTGFEKLFVANYNSAGAHQWSRYLCSTQAATGPSVAVDPSGNVIVTGDFDGTADFGGGNLVSAGATDVFIAKYNAVGVHQWSQRYGDTSYDEGAAVAVDLSGDVIVTGYFRGSVDFGGGALVGVAIEDIFVAKYTAAGVHRWSQRFGTTDSNVGWSLAVDPLKNVFLTGRFSDTTSLGGPALVAAGSYDLFVAKYTSEPAEPAISSITDVGNDEGRLVKIQFQSSWYDQASALEPVIQYEAYLRSDPLPSPASADVPSAPGRVSIPGWTFVAAVPAHAENEYEMFAPTLADSTLESGQHYSAFFIRAATNAPSVFYDSPPDSGYSVDNLSPGIPGGLLFSAGTLTWNESTANDFDYFSVYGGVTNAFGAATLIDYTVDPSLLVASTPYAYYFVTATDFSGNEGAPAVISAATGVGGTPTSYVLSVSAYPNPFNPATTIRYTLPWKGRVTIEVYDAVGARVGTLLDEERDAGAFTVPWTGRDDTGRIVSSGVYFARIAHASGSKSYKMVLLK